MGDYELLYYMTDEEFNEVFGFDESEIILEGEEIEIPILESLQQVSSAFFKQPDLNDFTHVAPFPRRILNPDRNEEEKGKDNFENPGVVEASSST